MAITINIRYKGTNGNAEKFVKEMTESGTVGAQQGPVRYDPGDPAGRVNPEVGVTAGFCGRGQRLQSCGAQCPHNGHKRSERGPV